MTHKLMETIETLEEKIESIKWMLITSLSPRKVGISETTSLIRKSAGILEKDSAKGIVYENKTRKEWKSNAFKRLA